METLESQTTAPVAPQGNKQPNAESRTWKILRHNYLNPRSLKTVIQLIH